MTKNLQTTNNNNNIDITSTNYEGNISLNSYIINNNNNSNKNIYIDNMNNKIDLNENINLMEKFNEFYNNCYKEDIILKEFCNFEILEKLYNIKDNIDENLKNIINSYIKEYDNSNGLTVKYNFNKSGRRFGNKSCCSTKLPRKLRNLLYKSKCDDVDMKSSCCNIYKNLIEIFNLDKNKYIEIINFNKNNLINEITETNKANKDKAKDLINQVFNGGNHNEIEGLIKLYYNIENLYNDLKKNKIFNYLYQKSQKTDFKKGSFLANVYQSIESKILDLSYNYLKLHNISIMTLEFDGFKICKSDLNTQEILNNLNKYIFENSGLKVEYIYKEMEIEQELFNMCNDLKDIKKLSMPKIIHDDEEAAEYSYSILKEYIKPINKDYMYVKNNNFIYQKKSYNELGSLFIKFNIEIRKVMNITDGKIIKTIAYSKMASGLKNILSKLMDILKLNYEEDFENQIVLCNRGRLPFQDGVYDFDKKKFYKWENIKFEYYCVYQVPYKYEDVLKSTITDKNFVKEKLFDNSIDNDKTVLHLLKRLSRFMAGKIRDKVWFNFMGCRNCGKGVIMEALKNSFGEYVKSFEVGNLVKNTIASSDVAKSQGWLIELIHCRIIYSNENAESKINGETIKKLSSGGDEFEARLLHCDKKIYNHNFHIICNTNGEITIEKKNKDVLKTLELIDFPNEYKNENEINEDEKNNQHIKIADSKIKDTICKNKKYNLALISLILDNYSDEIPINKNVKNSITDLYEGNQSEKEIVIQSKIFIFTDDENDKLFNSDIKKKWENCDDYDKINSILKVLKKDFNLPQFKNCGNRGLRKIKFR